VPPRRRALAPYTGLVLAASLRLWRRHFLALHVAALVLLAPMVFAPAFGVPADEAAACYLNIPIVSWWPGDALMSERYRLARTAMARMALCWTGTAMLCGCLDRASRERRAWLDRTHVVPALRAAAVASAAVALLVAIKALLVRIDVGLMLVSTAVESFLIATFWLLFPVLMIERVPIPAALERSVALVDDNRGMFFLLAFLVTTAELPLFLVLAQAGSPPPFLAVLALLATALHAALLTDSYHHVAGIDTRYRTRRTARVFE